MLQLVALVSLLNVYDDVHALFCMSVGISFVSLLTNEAHAFAAALEKQVFKFQFQHNRRFSVLNLYVMAGSVNEAVGLVREKKGSAVGWRLGNRPCDRKVAGSS